MISGKGMTDQAAVKTITNEVDEQSNYTYEKENDMCLYIPLQETIYGHVWT